MKALGRAVETDLGELAGIAWSRRGWLFGAAILAALIAFMASFLITPRYHSVASILPAKGFLREHNIVFGQGDIVDAVKLRPTTASNSQNVVTAASFKMRAAIVEELELVEFFGHADLATKDPALAEHRAMSDLRSATHFALSIYRDVLFIHVYTHDPEMSARIANLYIELIERENLAHYHAQASSMQSYLEGQLTQLRGEVLAMSDSLATYYSDLGLVDIDRERGGLFSLMATLQHQRSSLELSIARESLDRTDEDPYLLRMTEQLVLYDEMLAEYSPGGKPSTGRKVDSLLDPNTALIARDLERRLGTLQAREIRLRSELAGVVMEGAREGALLPVMDRAFPASEPYWPRRWLMMIGAAAIAIIGTYLVLLYLRAARTLAGEGRF